MPRLTIATNEPPAPQPVDQAAGHVIESLDGAVARLSAQDSFAVYLRLMNHINQRMSSMRISGLQPDSEEPPMP